MKRGVLLYFVMHCVTMNCMDVVTNNGIITREDHNNRIFAKLLKAIRGVEIEEAETIISQHPRVVNMRGKCPMSVVSTPIKV